MAKAETDKTPVSLGAHFAQVQLRLKQLVSTSDPHDRQRILESLEQFAFHAIPTAMGTETFAHKQLYDNNDAKVEQQISHEEAPPSSQDCHQAVDFNNNGIQNVPEISDHSSEQVTEVISCKSSSIDSLDIDVRNVNDEANVEKGSDRYGANVKLAPSRRQPLAIIDKLGSQLGQLERYAYETGQLERLPSSLLLERQAALIEHLRRRLDSDDFNKSARASMAASSHDSSTSDLTYATKIESHGKHYDDINDVPNDKMNSEQQSRRASEKNIITSVTRIPRLDRRDSITSHSSKTSPSEMSDDAIDDEVRELLMNPMLMDDQLVKQLKGQIANLERFIGMVLEQNPPIVPLPIDKTKKQTLLDRDKPGCATADDAPKSNDKAKNNNPLPREQTKTSNCNSVNNEEVHDDDGVVSRIVRRILTVIHVLTLTQFGCANIGKELASATKLRNLTTVTTSQPQARNMQTSNLPPVVDPRMKPEDWRPLVERVAVAIDEVIESIRRLIMLTKTTNGLVHDSSSTEKPFSKSSKEADAQTDNNPAESDNVERERTIDRSLRERSCGPGSARASPPAPLDLTKVNVNPDSMSMDMQTHVHMQMQLQQKLVFSVRKNLTMSLRDLLGHGLIGYQSQYCSDTTSSEVKKGVPSNMVTDSYNFLAALACLPREDTDFPPESIMQSRATKTITHPWHVIMRYYHSKSSPQYSSSSVRSLSQSFNLVGVNDPSLIGSWRLTSKHALLMAIDHIIMTMTRANRSCDSHLRALVSLALNQGKLAIWLRLIFRSKSIVKRHYQDWAFVKCETEAFDRVLVELERLADFVHHFNLPIERATRFVTH